MENFKLELLAFLNEQYPKTLNISPLIYKFLNETTHNRMYMKSILEDLEKQKFIFLRDGYRLKLTHHKGTWENGVFNDRYNDEEILAHLTSDGRAELFRLRAANEVPKASQTINVHGNITNSQLNQSSEAHDFRPTSYPNQKATNEIKQPNQKIGLLTRSWMFISNNALIAGIIATIIGGIIMYYLFGG